MIENVYDYIFKRKSTRKYKMDALPKDQLREIKDFADKLVPLYGQIKVEYEIAHSVKGLFSIKAPHYFIISSETKDGYLTNVGFMFQQMDLFLASKGIGSCWLGMAKPTEQLDSKLQLVIVLAFGPALKSPHRELANFKRKPLAEISSGSDERLACARLAPSATNSQNWFFVCDDGNIHIYKKKLNPVSALMYEKVNGVDIGIAICHLYVATLRQGKAFAFSRCITVKEVAGYTYIGTVD